MKELMVALEKDYAHKHNFATIVVDIKFVNDYPCLKTKSVCVGCGITLKEKI